MRARTDQSNESIARPRQTGGAFFLSWHPATVPTVHLVTVFRSDPSDSARQFVEVLSELEIVRIELKSLLDFHHPLTVAPKGGAKNPEVVVASSWPD